MMDPIRKKMQSFLRRKFGYKTYIDYCKNLTLEKSEVSKRKSEIKDKDGNYIPVLISHDLHVEIEDYPRSGTPITFFTTAKQSYVNSPEKTLELDTHIVSITLEELNAICAIANGFARENNWQS